MRRSKYQSNLFDQSINLLPLPYSIFALKRDLAPPEGLISFSKLLLLSAEEWGKAKAKSKPPKPKMDGDVLPVLLGVLKRRLSQYPTSTEVSLIV